MPHTNPFEKIPNLDAGKLEKLRRYAGLLREANTKVNLLSRKDMDDVEYRHIAFCASMGAFFVPHAGARIADVGTGGGLPGIVCAILYPQAEVLMFDGIGKKIKMIASIISELGLGNANAVNSRIEERKDCFDYATGRSVCALPMFFSFVRNRLRSGTCGNLSNGVIYFKGGPLEDELLKRKILPDAELKLDEFFSDPAYEGKRLLHFPKNILGK